MRIIDCNKQGWLSKNFIDTNDVYVGFDFDQHCCESYGYAITRKRPVVTDIGDLVSDFPEEDIEPFVFDTSFCEEVSLGHVVDSENLAIFRLTDVDEEIFLTIYNCHNGYYGHGFEFHEGDTLLKEGSL